MTPWEIASDEEAQDFIQALKPLERKRVLEACLHLMEDHVIRNVLEAFDLVDS